MVDPACGRSTLPRRLSDGRWPVLFVPATPNNECAARARFQSANAGKTDEFALGTCPGRPHPDTAPGPAIHRVGCDSAACPIEIFMLMACLSEYCCFAPIHNAGYAAPSPIAFSDTCDYRYPSITFENIVMQYSMCSLSSYLRVLRTNSVEKDHARSPPIGAKNLVAALR